MRESEERQKFIQFATKFMLNDFSGLLHKYGFTFENRPIAMWQFGMVVSSIYTGVLTRYTGKQILEEMLKARKA